MAFSSRVRVYHVWQNTDSDLRRVKQTFERSRTQGRVASDRVGHSMNQIADVSLIYSNAWCLYRA